MSKILYNPENGSTIKNMIVGQTGYFDDGVFAPGDIVKIESEQDADVILETFGFLEEISIEQAKGIRDRKEKNTIRCDLCEYVTDDAKKLQGHKLSHAKESKLDRELGIKVIKGKKQEKQAATGDQMQAIIDAEATGDGLVGEGLVKE